MQPCFRPTLSVITSSKSRTSIALKFISLASSRFPSTWPLHNRVRHVSTTTDCTSIQIYRHQLILIAAKLRGSGSPASQPEPTKILRFPPHADFRRTAVQLSDNTLYELPRKGWLIQGGVITSLINYNSSNGTNILRNCIWLWKCYSKLFWKLEATYLFSISHLVTSSWATTLCNLSLTSDWPMKNKVSKNKQIKIKTRQISVKAFAYPALLPVGGGAAYYS